MRGLLIRDARLRDGRQVDVRIDHGRITEVAPARSLVADREVLNAHGGLLLPGLHDHHLHLMATAAAAASVDCGPPDVTSRGTLAAVLREAAANLPPGDWVRGIRYHERMAGDLDRRALDEMVHGRPVRVQQRSGALWVINTAGLSALGVEHGDAPSGVERDAAGRATGRLWRLDGWLRGRLGPRLAPDLRQVGRDLAGHGVTGVTDATPDLDEAHLAGLLGAVASGALPQRLHLLGVDHLPTDVPPAVRERVTVGACKLVLADHDLPALPDLVARLRAIRASDRFGSRPVAVHSVSRVSLVLACVALSHAGPVRGDRIEHASVVPEGVLPVLRRLGVTVVTQPGLVSERGDDYLRDVDPGEVGDLYRHARLLDAGIPVGLSTDAPYTAADPWATIWAAVRRTTRRGRVLGPNERVDVATAVDGLTTPCDDPGGQPRRIAPGEVADLCLLEEPTITDHPAVQATVVAGVRSFAAS